MPSDLVSSVDFLARGYDCGYGGALRAFALANFLQEAAGANATRLGFGMEALNASGRTWMLSRLDLRVDASPHEGERLVAATWPAGTRKLFALRDIELRGEGGRSLARAVYAYLVVDMAARKPLRPGSVFGDDPPSGSRPHPVPDFSFDLPGAGEGELVFSQRVRPRHIDHNGHANNAHIVNWLVDAASDPRGGRSGGPRLAALRVEFSNEALEGDELSALRCPAQNAPFAASGVETAVLTRLERGASVVARALVGWRP